MSSRSRSSSGRAGGRAATAADWTTGRGGRGSTKESGSRFCAGSTTPGPGCPATPAHLTVFSYVRARECNVCARACVTRCLVREERARKTHGTGGTGNTSDIRRRYTAVMVRARVVCFSFFLPPPPPPPPIIPSLATSADTRRSSAPGSPAFFSSRPGGHRPTDARLQLRAARRPQLASRTTCFFFFTTTVDRVERRALVHRWSGPRGISQRRAAPVTRHPGPGRLRLLYSDDDDDYSIITMIII